MTTRSLLDDLDLELSQLNEGIVKERIENCRGSLQPGDKIPAADWEGMRSRLVFSFSTTQLSDYMSEYSHPRSELKDGTSRHSAVAVGMWEVFSNTTAARPRQVSKSATSRALYGKSLLAEKILRDCWQLSVAGEIGQIDLRLSSEFLSLLLHSKHFSFDEVSSLHEASIDINNSRGLVRVIGSQNACESIAEIVLDAAARIREEDVALVANAMSTGKNQPFNPEFLKWVNQTYGMFMQTRSGVPQKMFYLAENKLGVDHARRTLNLALYHTGPPSIPFSTYLPASEPASVYSLNPGENASWFDRQKTWFRWAMPSAEAAETETHSTPFFDQHQSQLSEELLKLLRDVPVANVSPKGNADVHESVSAAVGSCLFMRRPSFGKTAVDAARLGRMSLPRTFTTDIPRISSFLGSLSSIHPSDHAQPYRVRLTPTSSYAGVVPPLEIEFAVRRREDTLGAENDLVVRTVKAVLGTNSVDYLLPENSFDLRFTRTVYRDLLSESHDSLSDSPSHQAMLQSIQQYLLGMLVAHGAKDNLDTFPVFCRIPVPNDVLPQSISESHGISHTAEGELNNTEHGNAVTAEYMFPAVSNSWDTAVRQYDFQGRRLSYSFYESGPFLAARTTEVTLQMDIPLNAASNTDHDQPHETLEQGFHSFYQAACDLAFQINWASQMKGDDGLDLVYDYLVDEEN